MLPAYHSTVITSVLQDRRKRARCSALPTAVSPRASRRRSSRPQNRSHPTSFKTGYPLLLTLLLFDAGRSRVADSYARRLSLWIATRDSSAAGRAGACVLNALFRI